MKELNVRRLALTYAGSFLGAGFVSGQEIWQFFGTFGSGGWAGLLLTVLLLIGIGLIIMLLVERTGILAMDQLMIPWNAPRLRGLSAALQIIFYFGIIAIMYAGGGALVQQLFHIPTWVGSAAMCVLVTIVAIYGAMGIVRVYSLIVPVMVVFAMLTGIRAMLRFGISAAAPVSGETNPLLAGWLLGAVTYTAYNSFATVGIISPVAEIPHTRKVTYRGISLGGVLLLLIAFSVMGGILSCPETALTELPMLALSMRLSPALGCAYGVLLLFAMYGSALSCMVAVTNYSFIKYPKLKEKRVSLLFALGVVCFITGLGGFGDLIAVLYPLFGYCSLGFLGCLIWHFFHTKSSKEKSSADR